MTTNEQLQALLDAATPSPWHRPEIDVIGGRITSPNAAKSPNRLRNSSEIARLNHIVCIARSNPLADCIAVLHRHLPALLTGKIASADWEAVRIALKDADATLSGCADRLMVDRAKVVRQDEHGAHFIACPAAVEGHALRRREVIEVRSADGEDCENDAQLIVGMLCEARRLLIESVPYVVRSIGKTELILDEADAEFFDAHSWHLDNNELVNRQGQRLADLLTGTDGVWVRTGITPCDEFLLPNKAQDFRRCKLLPNKMPRPYTISVPPTVWGQIEAAAKAKGVDVGRYLGGLQHG